MIEIAVKWNVEIHVEMGVWWLCVWGDGDDDDDDDDEGMTMKHIYWSYGEVLNEMKINCGYIPSMGW